MDPPMTQWEPPLVELLWPALVGCKSVGPRFNASHSQYLRLMLVFLRLTDDNLNEIGMPGYHY